MATWNLIEDGAQFAGLPDNILSLGGFSDIAPIKYSGNLYIVGIRVETDVPQPYPRTLAVYKSTDSGATWTPLDTGSAPAILAAAAVFDGASTIHFAFSEPSTFPAETRLATFDLSAGTWGSVVTGGPTSAGYNYIEGRYLSIRLLSNGDRWIFYINGTIAVGANGIFAVKYDGAWGTPLTVAAGINHGAGQTRENYLKATAIDHLDRIYILLRRTDVSGGFPVGAFVYNTLASGALSGEQSTSTRLALAETNGLEDTTADTVDFPLIIYQGATDIGLLKISTADQSSTFEDIGNNPAGFTSALPWIASDGTNLYVFFEILNLSTTESGTAYYSRPIAGGIWTYTLFSDSNTDSLPDPNVGLPWETGSTTVAFFGGGAFGVVGSYGLITACGVMFYATNTQPAPGTCPITINAPPPPGTGPCLNAGTNPALDSYLELRKVLVAWKKETHLPVRGKS